MSLLDCRVTEEHIEVKFTGYEMLEWEGRAIEEAIPTYIHPLNHETAPLRQKDSQFDLREKLRKMSKRTQPLPPYPYPPPDGRLLMHASMAPPLRVIRPSHGKSQGGGNAGLHGRGVMGFLAR